MRRTEDNVKRDLRKQLAQDRAHWQAFVNSVVYLAFSKKAGISSTVWHQPLLKMLQRGIFQTDWTGQP